MNPDEYEVIVAELRSDIAKRIRANDVLRNQLDLCVREKLVARVDRDQAFLGQSLQHDEVNYLKRDLEQASVNFQTLQIQFETLQKQYQAAVAREQTLIERMAHLKTEAASRLIEHGIHRKTCITRYKNDAACDCGFVRAMRFL